MKEKFDKTQQLRKKAENKLKEINHSLNELPEEHSIDLKKLIYELQLHQVELEMQNEELLKTQASLEESRRAYKDLYDFAPVGYLTLDPDGVIRQANLTASFQTGKERLYLVGENLTRLILHEDQDKFYLYLRKIFKSEKVQDIQLRFKGEDNSEFHGLLTGKKVTKENKSLCNVAINDITEKVITEKALKESNATKDKFFSIIGHDLKGPLANIFSLSQLLSSNVREKNYDNLEKLSHFIEKSTHQVVNLINNLLEWARTQTDSMNYNPEKLLVQDLIDNFTGLMEVLARNKNIRLEYDFPEGLKVYADRNMLHTVLRNLLSNAIKYTYPDGEVKLTAVQKADKVLFSVKDNGIGMKPEQMDKLFKIDSHFSMQGTKKEKGTGLGLIISKEFIEKQGGCIWVESEFKKGSVFYFTVLLAN